MTHGAFGLGVQPATWTRRLPQLDEEEDVEALQPDRLDREEIDGQQTLPVGADELALRRFPALPCRPEAGGAKPRTHCRR